MPKIRRHAKTDVRFWKEVIFRRKRGTEEDANWTVQIQYLKREQFPLDTPNKDAAATKAREIYLSLHSRGWEETLAIYKPQPEVVEVNPERSTIGGLIREVSDTTNYRVTTFSVYCAALRRIAADLLNLHGEKSRFCAKGQRQPEVESLGRCYVPRFVYGRGDPRLETPLLEQTQGFSGRLQPGGQHRKA